MESLSVTEKPAEEKSWLASIPEQLVYAWGDPEQRFEWAHLTRRRFFRNLCNMPGELLGWAITTKERGKKPLFPDLSGKTSYNGAGQIIDSSLFTGIVFKQALDIGAKFGLSAFVKTAVSGYNRNEAYKSLLSASANLRHMAAYVVHADPALEHWAEGLAQRDESALLRLSRHTGQASEIMMEFCQGGLLPTDKNLTRLQEQLDAIAQLCDRKAGLLAPSSSDPAAMKHPAFPVMEQHLPEAASHASYSNRMRPSDHIRDVLKADNISTAKQAVVYLATLSGLVADGATEISREMFTPKEERYFSPEDAHKVALALKRFGAAHAAGEPSPQDIIGLANTIKSSLRLTEKKLEPLLAYADAHFADIDRKLKQKESAPIPIIPPRLAPVSLQTATRKLDGRYYEPQKAGLDYILRDETRHEMFKLYSRSLPTYLYQAPINLIERLILPNAKGKWQFNKRVIGSELKAASWMAAYNPVAESFGGVSTYEATRLDLHQAVESGKRLDAFMAAAVQSAQEADPEFALKLSALAGNQAYQTLIDAHREVLAKPADKKTGQDYAAMGELMRKLALQAKDAQKECHALLIGSDESASLKDHIAAIFSHGASTTADAFLVLTLARFLEHAAEGQILSYEYVDPDGAIMDKDSLKKIAANVLAAAKNGGFAVAGETLVQNGQPHRIGEKEGIAAGTLVKLQDDGRFRAVNKQEFIGFANAIVQAMSNDKGALIQKFMDAAHGRMSDKLINDVEHAVLEQFQAPRAQAPEEKPLPAAPLASMLKKRPEHAVSWRDTFNYVTRPEAVHEMRQLRDRSLAVSLFGFPVKIASNILRGDFTKISTAFGKWSLASTAFAAVANTLAPSYGAVALKEAVSAGGDISLKRGCAEANAHLQTAIARLGNTVPEMKNRLVASLGINPLLENKDTIEQLALTGNANEALNMAATAFIDHAATALAGKPRSVFPAKINHSGELFTHILKLPAGNPAYAALKLAALDSFIAHEKKYIDVLRYEGTSARLLDNKQLKRIVDHIEDRFYTEGGRLNAASIEYVTALADELANAALSAIGMIKTGKTSEYQPGSEWIKRDIASSISRG